MRISSLVYRWLAIAWTIIILIGCLTPHHDLPGELTAWNDKFMHIAIFAPFAVLWILAGFRMSYVLLASVLLGGLIEILQYILPINRSADWFDLLADGVGALVGLCLAWVVQKTYKPVNS